MLRRLHWFPVLGLLLVAALLVPQRAAAQSGTIQSLQAGIASNVSGSLSVSADAQGNASLSVSLTGLSGGETAQINLNSGTCAQPSASVLSLLTMRADDQGRVTGFVPVMIYRGEPLKLVDIADGNHVVTVIIGDRPVACGAIPAIGNPDQPGGGGDLGAALLAEGERLQVMQFNPGAALQKRIFADGFVPNSGEFNLVVEATAFVAQRAEHMGTGTVRVYFVRSGDWGNVRYYQRGAGADAFGRLLLEEGERRQVIRFNPAAALQRRIFADGFVPNSSEFAISLGGLSYTGQRAEHLGTGRVRVYYAVTGQWNVVRHVDRTGPVTPPRPPDPNARPAVSMSPESGPTGTMVRLTGTNFPPYATVTAWGGPVQSEGIQLAASTTDGSGRTVMDVWVQGAPGAHWAFWIVSGETFARSPDFVITQ